MAEVVTISVTRQDTYVLPDNKTVTPGHPLTLTITYLEDNGNVREAVANAVKVGLLVVTYKGNTLTVDQVINIDELREGSGGGGGGTDILAASTMLVSASSGSPVSYVDVTFSNPDHSQYAPAIFTNQNVNVYYDNMTETGFRAYFSAPITENFYFSYIVAKSK